MKKIVFIVAFIFATVSVINAKPFAKENIKKEVENDYNSCLDDAWDYGKRHGHGDETAEWYYTDRYYRANCENRSEAEGD